MKKKSTYAKFPTSPQHFINKEVTLENRTGWIARLFCYPVSLRDSILTSLKISNREFLGLDFVVRQNEKSTVLNLIYGDNRISYEESRSDYKTI